MTTETDDEIVPRAGVIGWPVQHSRSPKLHGYWLKQHGLKGRYDRLPVPPEDVGPFLEALRGAMRSEGFRGVNVTLPLKLAVMPYLDEIEPEAKRIGAVNTIVVRDDGTLLGKNTDGFGFLAHLKASQPGWRPEAGPAVVLGAGGGARAVVCALLDSGVPQVRLVNRSLEKAGKLAEQLGGNLSIQGWDEAAQALEGASLLVNTTSLGMAGQPPLELDLGPLPGSAVVCDIVYTPLETPLLAAAARRGNAAVDGLGMLLHQGRPGFAAWFGVWPEVTEGLRAAVLAD